MKNFSYKLFPLLISLLFIFPIVRENIGTLLMILLCVNTLNYSIATKNYKNFNFNYLLFTIPFWIIVFRSIFSESISDSLSHIQQSLFFLIFPICFSLIPNDFFSIKKINLYLTILKNICLLITFIYVISYIISTPFWKFNIVVQHVSVFREYIYNDFKLFIIHPSYYTSILIVCIAHSLEMVLNQKKYFQLFYIICFLVISFLLLTRLNIVLQIILIIGMLLNSQKLQLKYRVLFLVGILSITTTLTIYTPGIKARFVELIKSYDVKPENLAYDSTNVRKAIYDCSLDISKDNLIFGVGFNNLQSQLNNCYQSNYNSNFYIETNYLTHNYYFYILISSGLIGLGFFGFYLLNIIKISLKSDNLIFKIFILHSLIICFVEDYFYRQRGILFFNLILMCYIKYSEKEVQNSILNK